jgi:hypothetical protein
MDAATTPPAKPFKVVFDLHVIDGPVRMVRSFRTEAEARSYAALCNPDDDGKLYPNVRDESWKRFEDEGFEYFSGIFWRDTNRPAVIMHWNPYAFC